MKNLANCTPREFMRQTSRIRHAAEAWLKMTDIANIRKRMPMIPDSATEEERDALLAEQARDNIAAMLDAIMDRHPDETAELLALCCFVEPEDIDAHPMKAYLASVAEMLDDEDVVRFFTSLLKLARRVGFTA